MSSPANEILPSSASFADAFPLTLTRTRKRLKDKRNAEFTKGKSKVAAVFIFVAVFLFAVLVLVIAAIQAEEIKNSDETTDAADAEGSPTNFSASLVEGLLH